jgi:GxxExxY protein
VVYEAVRIHTGVHADLVVEDAVMVEIKALKSICAVHKKQLLTYLKLADKRLGLPINVKSS